MSPTRFNVKNLKGLTQDSRQVREGYLFAALPGAKADGREFIADAVRNGASAILAVSGAMLPEGVSEKDVILINDDNPRHALSMLAAEFYGKQPDTIAAVTGTNGKTSTVHFAKQLWKGAGLKAASIGTLGVRAPGMIRSGSMTTPDPVALHAELADLAAAGITHLAMEASSHGLHQCRLDGVKVKAAAFTNLTRDHLDYHETMEEYFAAKARLFSDVMKNGTAVLNADIPEYEDLKKICKKAGHKIISYGFKGEDIKLTSAHPMPHGQKIKLEVFGESYDFLLPLVGGFQIMNALCALGLVIAENPAGAKFYVEALKNLKGAPGRLQLVTGHPKGAAIYIDYAHTPDALENVLKAVQPHTTRKTVCLFGCGGDRDKGKRPIMGKIAERLADTIIVTDDNPRSEDAAVIRKEILAAAPNAREIPGRREAIQAAVKELEEGDVLVIAGKGHEQGQVFADHIEPFDDVEEAQKAIKSIK